jgi:hypothetical protein
VQEEQPHARHDALVHAHLDALAAHPHGHVAAAVVDAVRAQVVALALAVQVVEGADAHHVRAQLREAHGELVHLRRGRRRSGRGRGRKGKKGR